MGIAYGLFGVGLAAVCAVGSVGAALAHGLGRGSVIDAAVDRVETLVAVVACITAAGLVSLAFLADKLAAADVGARALSDPHVGEPAAWVVFALTWGAAGLLAGLVAAVSRRQGVRRWAAWCLLVSALALVVSFPAIVALVLAVADSATAAS